VYLSSTSLQRQLCHNNMINGTAGTDIAGISLFIYDVGLFNDAVCGANYVVLLHIIQVFEDLRCYCAVCLRCVTPLSPVRVIFEPSALFYLHDSPNECNIQNADLDRPCTVTRVPSKSDGPTVDSSKCDSFDFLFPKPSDL
jgi:hypothetical protein